MTRTAIPSPHGTNKAGLYFPYDIASFKGGYAYDSENGLETDPDDAPAPKADPEDRIAEAFMTVKSVLARMAPEDRKEFLDELLGEQAEDDKFATPQDRLESELYKSNDPKRSGTAMDAMAFDRLGQPRTTAAQKSFEKMHPDAAKVRSGPGCGVKFG